MTSRKPARPLRCGRTSCWDARERPAPISAGMTSAAWRSEEHTSELQSLMRISYAVFCLKKKNKEQDTCIIHKEYTRAVITDTTNRANHKQHKTSQHQNSKG